jgi:hypothetical protein
VRSSPPAIREAFLGDHSAEVSANLGRGSAARVSSLVPEGPVPSGLVTGHGIPAAVYLVPLRLTPLGIGWVALLWALTLGQAPAARNLGARGECHPPEHSVQTASTDQVQPGSPDPVAPWGGGWILRLHKRSHAFHKSIPLSDDPNDDETSDDPNDDDDAWDDLTGDDGPGAPVIACLQQTVRYLLPPEAGSAPDSTARPSSPFLMLQRLRC